MARFTRNRKYNRLIGRISLLEIILVYFPAIALNIYDLYYFTQDQQIWYITLDSLILILYALVLIIVVMTTRERVLDISYLLDFKELFSFNVKSDTESMYEFDPDDPKSLRLKDKYRYDENLPMSSDLNLLKDLS